METTFPAPTNPTPPRTGVFMVDRLASEYGMPFLGEGDLDLFLTGGGLRVVFVTGDPVKLLDTVDIAVILPELCRHFAGKIEPGVLERNAEPLVATRYGVDVRPALVFFTGDRHLGTIPRVRDWDEYLAKIAEFIAHAGETPAPTRQ